MYVELLYSMFFHDLPRLDPGVNDYFRFVIASPVPPNVDRARAIQTVFSPPGGGCARVPHLVGTNCRDHEPPGPKR